MTIANMHYMNLYMICYIDLFNTAIKYILQKFQTFPPHCFI